MRALLAVIRFRRQPYCSMRNCRCTCLGSFPGIREPWTIVFIEIIKKVFKSFKNLIVDWKRKAWIQKKKNFFLSRSKKVNSPFPKTLIRARQFLPLDSRLGREVSVIPIPKVQQQLTCSTDFSRARFFCTPHHTLPRGRMLKKQSIKIDCYEIQFQILKFFFRNITNEFPPAYTAEALIRTRRRIRNLVDIWKLDIWKLNK